MLKKYALVIAVLYLIVITILSFISLESTPNLGIDFADKLVHFAIYFLFALLWFNYFNAKRILKPIAKSILFAVVYGIIIEVLQESLTDSRQFDYYDIVANVLGALLIIPFLQLLKSYVKK